MRSKQRLFFWLLPAVFLLALLAASVWAKSMDCGKLLLVTPDRPGMTKISAGELEKINGKEFLLTYEILSKESVQALNEQFDATLKKTNAAYPFIARGKMIEGSFFTEQDQKEKKKVAVLNQTAAHRMFGTGCACGGTLKIGQDEYTVTGVMDDKKEEEVNLYLPAACFGEDPESFAIRTTDGLVLGRIKNECKAVVSADSGYRFISFGILEDLIDGIFFIGLKLAGIGILLILLRMSHIRLKHRIRKIRRLTEQIYLRELFRYYSKELLKVFAAVAGAVLAVVVMFSLTISLLDYYLFWKENMPLLQQADPTVFGETASILAKDFYLSLLMLTGLFVSVVVLLSQEFRRVTGY